MPSIRYFLFFKKKDRRGRGPYWNLLRAAKRVAEYKIQEAKQKRNHEIKKETKKILQY